MINGVKLIFLGRFVPYAGINHDLGFFRSVNWISFVIYKDFTAIILFRRAEDIVTGTDLACRIFNKVIICQSGLFNEVQPGGLSAVIFRIKII